MFSEMVLQRKVFGDYYYLHEYVRIAKLQNAYIEVLHLLISNVLIADSLLREWLKRLCLSTKVSSSFGFHDTWSNDNSSTSKKTLRPHNFIARTRSLNKTTAKRKLANRLFVEPCNNWLTVF